MKKNKEGIKFEHYTVNTGVSMIANTTECWNDESNLAKEIRRQIMAGESEGKKVDLCGGCFFRGLYRSGSFSGGVFTMMEKLEIPLFRVSCTINANSPTWDNAISGCKIEGAFVGSFFGNTMEEMKRPTVPYAVDSLHLLALALRPSVSKWSGGVAREIASVAIQALVDKEGEKYAA